MKTVQETIGRVYIAVDSSNQPLKLTTSSQAKARFWYKKTVAVMLENNAYRIFAEFEDDGETRHLFKSWAFGKWISVMNPDIHLEIDTTYSYSDNCY